MNKALKLLNALILIMTLSSCGKEIFSVPKNTKNSNTPNVGSNSAFNCSQSTLVRPPVDILILMDNSSSANYITNGVKDSLAKLINEVSSRFDYQIVIAPLIRTSSNVNDRLKVVVSPHSTTSAVPSGYRISEANAVNHLQNIVNAGDSGGTGEAGLRRVNEIVRNNISNGIFRVGAYHIFTVVSNGDDHSFVTTQETGTLRNAYIQSQFKELMCLRGNYSGSACSGPTLNSRMTRFLSVISLNEGYCSAGVYNAKVGDVYRDMSSRVYSEPYNNGIDSPTDHNGTSKNGSFYYDVTDMCSKNVSTVFDSINNIIKDVTIKHVYRYWPVANSDFDLDESTIQVTQNNGQVLNRIPNYVVNNIVKDNNGKNDIDSTTGSKVSGWYYHGNTMENTRFLPTNGEMFSGHLIELFGDAKVTFPSCLKVTSKAMPNYYGYAFVSAYKPLESTLQVYINGNKINQSSTSGWELLTTKFVGGHYVEIMGPGNYSQKPGGKVDSRSGYYIKLNGPSVYSNNATIKIQSQSTSE